MEEKTKKRVVSTGNPEIDSKLGGGIPIGSLTLIDGDSSAGKSVLTQQMIWGSLNDQYRASLFTFENTVRSLITQMESLNLDVLDFVLLNRFKIYPVQATRLKMLDLLALPILMQAMRREKDSDLVFVDSLTSLVVDAPEEKVIGFFEQCKELCGNGMGVITVVHSHALKEGLLIRIRSLCDAHLRLCTEALGEQLVKTLEVSKVRGANKTTGNIVSFEIEPAWGMRIIPLSRASV